MLLLQNCVAGHSTVRTYQATPSLPIKFQGDDFGGVTFLHDNCAVSISPSHPPAPFIAALEGAREHFECVYVCVCVCFVCVCVSVFSPEF